MSADPKSKALVHQVLSQTILPLYEAIQKQCRQLDEQFFRSEGIIRLGGKEKADLSLRTQSWNNLEKNWLNSEGFSRQFESGLEQFNYEYHWIDFEKTGEPFNVICVLNIELQAIQYDVKFDGIYKKYRLIKGYNENISKEEIDKISTLFVKEALAQIKEKTKK